MGEADATRGALRTWPLRSREDHEGFCFGSCCFAGPKGLRVPCVPPLRSCPSPRMAQPYYPPSFTVALGLLHASPTHCVFRFAPCTLPAPTPSPWTALKPIPVLQLFQLTPPALLLLPHLTRLFGHCCSLCPLSLTTSDPLAPFMSRR